MSTPSWRLPAARLEGAQSARALNGLHLATSVVLLVYTAAGGRWVLALLAIAVLGVLMLRPRRDRLRAFPDFLFDGRRWYDGDGRAATVTTAYTSPLVLAVRMEVEGNCYRGLLFRVQCCAESWRRLRLALRYAGGDSTVSPASGSSSG